MTRLIQYAIEALTAGVIIFGPAWASWLYYGLTGKLVD